MNPSTQPARLLPLPHLHRGKVRDLYQLDQTTMLMVASDRISAYDVVLPTPVPGKGAMLAAISTHWFQLASALPNPMRTHHIARLADHPPALQALRQKGLSELQIAELATRTTVCVRAAIVPVECVVRGYLAGSLWADYTTSRQSHAADLPPGLAQAARLPEPIFTPTTKAPVGQHDLPLSFPQTVNQLGTELATGLRDASISLYLFAAEHAQRAGLILADTKFEFGLAPEGSLMLCDELLTPDSSRYWDAAQWRPGAEPPSFDKQFVRDYLQNLVRLGRWNRQPPGPELPADIVRGTLERYREAARRLGADPPDNPLP